MSKTYTLTSTMLLAPAVADAIRRAVLLSSVSTQQKQSAKSKARFILERRSSPVECDARQAAVAITTELRQLVLAGWVPKNVQDLDPFCMKCLARAVAIDLNGVVTPCHNAHGVFLNFISTASAHVDIVAAVSDNPKTTFELDISLKSFPEMKMLLAADIGLDCHESMATQLVVSIGKKIATQIATAAAARLYMQCACVPDKTPGKIPLLKHEQQKIWQQRKPIPYDLITQLAVFPSLCITKLFGTRPFGPHFSRPIIVATPQGYEIHDNDSWQIQTCLVLASGSVGMCSLPLDVVVPVILSNCLSPYTRTLALEYMWAELAAVVSQSAAPGGFASARSFFAAAVTQSWRQMWFGNITAAALALVQALESAPPGLPLIDSLLAKARPICATFAPENWPVYANVMERERTLLEKKPWSSSDLQTYEHWLTNSHTDKFSLSHARTLATAVQIIPSFLMTMPVLVHPDPVAQELASVRVYSLRPLTADYGFRSPYFYSAVIAAIPEICKVSE